MLNNMFIQSILTNRLLLRKFKITDANDLYDILSCESELNLLFENSPHINYELTLERLQEIIESYSSNNILTWAIEYNQKVIGIIEVNFNRDNSTYEINYNISDKVDDRSILVEAINSIDDYLKKWFIKIKNYNNKKNERSFV